MSGIASGRGVEKLIVPAGMLMSIPVILLRSLAAAYSACSKKKMIARARHCRGQATKPPAQTPRKTHGRMHVDCTCQYPTEAQGRVDTTRLTRAMQSPGAAALHYPRTGQARNHIDTNCNILEDQAGELKETWWWQNVRHSSHTSRIDQAVGESSAGRRAPG
jgi:hypothetical protein